MSEFPSFKDILMHFTVEWIMIAFSSLPTFTLPYLFEVILVHFTVEWIMIAFSSLPTFTLPYLFEVILVDFAVGVNE